MSINYKFDYHSLEMINDLIEKILTGKHKGDDIQKDLILAQRGLNMLVEEMIDNRIYELENKRVEGKKN